METLMKQKGMDQDCNTELCLALSLGIGTNTSEEDQMSASQRNVKGPPLLLDLFPLAPVLPHDSGCRSLSSVLQHDSGCRSLSSVLQHDSGCGTLPCEKTSPGMDGGAGGERSAGKEKLLAIHPVTVSWRSDANKFPASCYYNEDAATSNSTVGSNAINQKHSYAMDLKRNRGATEELQNGRVCSRLLNDVDLEEEGGTKKKLRLSRDQCAVLAESFRKNSAPEPNQKQALALQLNLLPRQVEVWFQNRRARTKLKQTEEDCELLKRCNESLVEENRKLHKEVEELRAMKWASPLTALCPSCQRVSTAHSSGPFTLEETRSIFLRGAFRQ